MISPEAWSYNLDCVVFIDKVSSEDELVRCPVLIQLLS